MNSAAASIFEMYRLQGQAFEDQFRVKSINIRRSLLEEFIGAPVSDADANLETQGRLLVLAQREIGAAANLTTEQEEDFASRLDDVVADAIVKIRRCLEQFPDRYSTKFQLDAARRLGIPVA